MIRSQKILFPSDTSVVAVLYQMDLNFHRLFSAIKLFIHQASRSSNQSDSQGRREPQAKGTDGDHVTPRDSRHRHRNRLRDDV